MNATIDSEVAKMVKEHVCKLSNEVEKMTFENQEEMNYLKIMLDNIQLNLQEFDNFKRSQEAVEQRVTELESQEKCNAPETSSHGEF